MPNSDAGHDRGQVALRLNQLGAAWRKVSALRAAPGGRTVLTGGEEAASGRENEGEPAASFLICVLLK